MEGKITRLVNTFGSSWGRVRLDLQPREVFFNLESLLDPTDFARLAEGDRVDFEEELERANGMHAIKMRLVAPRPAGETVAAGSQPEAGA